MDPIKRIRSFLLLAFGYTWSVAGIGTLLGVDADSGAAYMVMAGLCMLGPTVAALVQHRVIDKAPWSGLALHPGLIHGRSLALTALIGLCLMPLCMLVVFAIGDGMGLNRFGHVSVTGERFAVAVQELLAQLGRESEGGGLADLLARLPGGLILLALLISALIAAFSFNLPFMLGEELGWRGYLYQATVSWSAGRRIAFTGFFWGLWHAPLIAMGHNYPGYPILGIGLMVVFCLLLAVLFDWSRTRVQSVWGPCVLHGLINGTAGSMALFAWDGHVLFGSPVGVGGMLAIIVLIAAVLVLDGPYRRQLLHGPTTMAPRS